MTEKNKNPNAFPADTVKEDYSGMSLRDYFAAKAMQALTSHYGIPYGNGSACDDRAKESYKIADSMLKAREQ
jgi:hypothetical protein